MPSPRLRTLFVVGLATGAVGLSGCGGGADASGSATTTSLATGSGSGSCSPAPALPTDVQTFDAAPDPASVRGTTVTATITTNCGDITLELYADRAPQTVASFEQLAQAGYWDDSPCFRLTTAGIFVLQCGDPTGTGSGSPGYGFGIENAPADGRYPSGTLAMARTQDPNSNGGQFFIVYDDTSLPTQGGGYSIFGKVTEGLDIVKAVAQQGVDPGSQNPQDGSPVQPISILKVVVTEQKA
ncbi:peptidylprolyl isomerase [Segeticoccus rhizosphaerae]|jgi:peptidyl-prolyl cis-trans isomerase B (cyclophilin B)|uniref:peptidylprolyl isomerase n=1 Tax=Segeticoccus rhizosphaerae TaxID=1104777 RepID=UPI001EE47637|nr:peptidylprolyl isomerase [Ornithinicoccus soli]